MDNQRPSHPTLKYGARIAATGIGLPETVCTNDDLAQKVDTSDEWITQRTGIHQRYIVDEQQNTCGLGVLAAKDALNNARLVGTDIDLVIVATMTAEMRCPSTAARIAAEIGATPAGAVDLSAACAGFVYALNHAEPLLRCGHYKRILVIGAETMSKVVNWEDRRTCVLFGDGAAAAILERSDDPAQGCLLQKMHADGTAWDKLYIPEQLADTTDPKNFDGKLGTLQMNGQEVFKFAVSRLQQSVKTTLEEAGIAPSELKHIFAHQSNLRILEMLRSKLRLSKGSIYTNIHKYGNTSAASVAIALHEVRQEQGLKPGDLCLFIAIGGGMAWTTSLWRM